jgi:hypothetical protein
MPSKKPSLRCTSTACVGAPEIDLQLNNAIRIRVGVDGVFVERTTEKIKVLTELLS